MVSNQADRPADRMVFIIGMPRSGTKLLTKFLVRHPQMAGANVETDFLPLWIENWAGYGDLSDRTVFKRFYGKTIRLPYFVAMKDKGRLIPEETWYDRCADFSVAGVFETLLRYDARGGDGGGKILIDKSPSYTRHAGLLRQHFPRARFIHIIRDVRDYCLSIHQAWGKNMIRAAYRWKDGVQKARREGQEMGSDYMEIKYEELLENPRTVIEKICDFMGVGFDEKMLEFSKPTEYVGDAKGLVGLKQDNIEKYVRLMNARTRRTIEGITAPVLRSLGYPVEYDGKAVQVSRGRMAVYQIADALNILRTSIKERGILNALRLNLRALIMRR